MKSIRLIITSLTALILTSCFSSSNSENNNLSREEILGTWKLSVQSLKDIDLEKESSTITSFQLNADSTAVFYLADSPDKKTEGTWTWDNEKKIGNEDFGISIENDVMIYSKNKTGN